MKLYTADHVLPISSAPIERGAVAVSGERIEAVGTADDLAARFTGAEVISLGKAAIMPGLVNCHAHLEISSLRGALDDVERDFSSWLLKLTALRRAMTDEDIFQSALIGTREAAAAGVTFIADIGRYGFAGLRAMKETGLRGRAHQETEFSLPDELAEDEFRKLIAKYDALCSESTGLVRVGLSPHAPYTVGRRLFRLITDFSVKHGVPLTIHAAESQDEHSLLVNGTGIFPEMFKKFGVEWRSPHRTSIEYLNDLGVLEAAPLFAHCITVSDTDLELVTRSGSTIAHCPKSNAKFGHGYAPFERMLGHGIAVGLGSDSVASNNVCDILEEARFASFAARNREGSERFLTARDVLHAATLGGAAAVGMQDQIGSLEPGKQADIAVFSLSSPAQQPVNDVEAALVFSSNARDTILTLVAGKEVFSK